MSREYTWLPVLIEKDKLGRNVITWECKYCYKHRITWNTEAVHQATAWQPAKCKHYGGKYDYA